MDSVRPQAPRQSADRGAGAFVWGVWLLMLLACGASLVLYTRDLPLTEDWLLVSMLTGNEPSVLQSLWAQNNEHRIPLPKLILLGLLEVTGGDFRVGMVLNVVLLGAAAAGLIHLARSIRGGVTRYADAFFPVGLLHVGHWENLFWSWEVTQVVPVVLLIAVIYQVVRTPELSTRGAAGSAAVSVIALPLCGGIGVLFAPFWAAWVGYCGVRLSRRPDPGPRRAGVAATLLVSAATALVLVGVYFVGYERPPWVPTNPGLVASLVAAAHFVALGLGPVARSSWVLSIAAAALLFIPTIALVVKAPLRTRGTELHRALGFLLVALGLATFVLAMGWGRAGVVAIDRTWPIRYALFAVPVYVAAFLAWELYGDAKSRRIAQNGMAAVMLLLIPLNSQHGIWWRDWYLGEAERVTAALREGAWAADLARDHGSFLHHAMDPGALEDLMLMLMAAEMGPWPQLRDAPSPRASSAGVSAASTNELVAQEIRYQRASASEVVLVWGIDGWDTLPGYRRPPGTYLQDNVMYTPMTRVDEIFVSTVPAPPGTTIDYGFLTTRDGSGSATSIWDGDYSSVASGSGAVFERVSAPNVDSGAAVSPAESRTLVDREFHYRLPGAGVVVLIWGVDGWRSVPAALDRGEGTVLENGLMNTPMRRVGDRFSATVPVPSGAYLEYGFLITDRTGVFDLVRPLWDSHEDNPHGVIDDRVINVGASVTLPNEVAEALALWRQWTGWLLLLLGFWTAFYLILGRAPPRQAP